MALVGFMRDEARDWSTRNQVQVSYLTRAGDAAY
jgi:hypothetical protein